MAPARTKTPPPAPKLGLRERKKIRTRQAIRMTAYRLFAEQGYDATPVDQIAEEAEVSPSTVFRYFPTKEDIVLTDEYDPLMEQALKDRPADEPPIIALRHAIMEVLEQAYEVEPAETYQRIRLACEVPAIRARMTESAGTTSRFVARALSERTGRPLEDLELRVYTGAVLGGLTEAMLYYGEYGAEEDLVEVVRRSLDVLERGLSSSASGPAASGSSAAGSSAAPGGAASSAASAGGSAGRPSARRM
ncbi:TetR/AcrR family transcriptional regulator [Streptomyces daliensis]|uniref:TetR family transcriptional regulator n=1 Tax=Streptomyces daliensis TaxID=299421 RepID=A0A8T4INN8_9ACTN|nr:TetR family transcriptional regulator [Streptomyces daliensis]